MRVSTVVFDLDGTLTDPSVGIVRCVNYALEKRGYPTRSDAEISGEIGPPLDLMFRKFIPAIELPAIEKLVGDYRERFGVYGYAENLIYDGIPRALKSLQDRGLPMGVCTSKPKASAERVLEHFGLSSYMQFVSGGDIGIAKQKQLETLLAEGCIDEHAVMIGDRGVDLFAAHNNNLRSVGVLWGFGAWSELSAEKPELIIQAVDELPDCFQSM